MSYKWVATLLVSIMSVVFVWRVLGKIEIALDSTPTSLNLCLKIENPNNSIILGNNDSTLHILAQDLNNKCVSFLAQSMERLSAVRIE